MLGKRQINFLQKEDFDQTPLGKFLKWATTAGRWIVVLTDLIVISAFFSRFYFDTKLANLHDVIKQDQAIIEAMSSFEESFRFLQKRLNIIKALSDKKFTTEDKALFVVSVLPEDVVLKSIYFSPQEVNFSGTAGSQTGTEVLVRNLLASPKISKVNISQLSFGGKGEPGTINFTISATWKNL